MIGLAADTDQFLDMAAVADAGYGILLRARRATDEAIHEAVSRAINDDRLARAVRAARDAIARYDPGHGFRATLDKVLDRSNV